MVFPGKGVRNTALSDCLALVDDDTSSGVSGLRPLLPNRRRTGLLLRLSGWRSSYFSVALSSCFHHIPYRYAAQFNTP